MGEENNTDKLVADNELMQTSLMEKLEKLQKKQLMYSRLGFIAIAILVVGILMVLPSLQSTLKSAKTTLDNTNEVVEQAKTTLDQVDVTLKDVSKMANQGTEGIVDALGTIDELNIEGLNGAIGDLQAVVEPLARLFGR